MKVVTGALLGLELLAITAPILPAQEISATLTGAVADPSNAVVAQAQVRLRNEASGSERITLTNSVGYFSFAAMDAGDYTYELTVTAKNFAIYRAPGITLGGGEVRTVNVTLQVGNASEPARPFDSGYAVIQASRLGEGSERVDGTDRFHQSQFSGLFGAPTGIRPPPRTAVSGSLMPVALNQPNMSERSRSRSAPIILQQSSSLIFRRSGLTISAADIVHLQSL